jgi:hypothetical protein
MSYNAGSGLYPTPYRPYDPVAGRQPSQDALLNQSDRTAKLYAGVDGNPFSFLDWQGLNTSQMAPVGDGSSSPYVAYGDGARNGPGGTPPLDPDSVRPAGMAPFALSRPSLLSFVGAGRATPVRCDAPSVIPAGARRDAARLVRPHGGSRQCPSAATVVGRRTASGEGWKVDTGPRRRSPGRYRRRPEVDPTLPASPMANRPRMTMSAVNNKAHRGVRQQGSPRRRQSIGDAAASDDAGRCGYLTRSVEEIERGMMLLQIQINRDQAFRELTPAAHGRPGARALRRWNHQAGGSRDDRAGAERHGVPIQMFARQLYQEGSSMSATNARPLIMDSDRAMSLGRAQMDKNTPRP